MEPNSFVNKHYEVVRGAMSWMNLEGCVKWGARHNDNTVYDPFMQMLIRQSTVESHRRLVAAQGWKAGV